MEIRQAFVRKVYTILCKFCAAVPALEYSFYYPSFSLPNSRNLHLRWRPVAFHRGYYLDRRAVSTPANFLGPFPHLHFHSPWTLYVPLFGTLINLGLLYWKRHSHPWNLVLLSTFTLMEAYTLGVMVAFFDTKIVFQALYVSHASSPHISSLTSLPQPYHTRRLPRPNPVYLPVQV